MAFDRLRLESATCQVYAERSSPPKRDRIEWERHLRRRKVVGLAILGGDLGSKTAEVWAELDGPVEVCAGLNDTVRVCGGLGSKIARVCAGLDGLAGFCARLDGPAGVCARLDGTVGSADRNLSLLSGVEGRGGGAGEVIGVTEPLELGPIRNLAGVRPWGNIGESVYVVFGGSAGLLNLDCGTSPVPLVSANWAPKRVERLLRLWPMVSPSRGSFDKAGDECGALEPSAMVGRRRSGDDGSGDDRLLPLTGSLLLVVPLPLTVGGGEPSS
jgi:hypothetical protein